MLAKVEFVVPSVLNKGQGEKKISIQASDMQDAFTKVSEQLGDDFRRRVFDHNGKPRSLINIYINGKNVRFSGVMSAQLNDGDSIYVLPAVAGGAELTSEELQRYSRQVMLEEIGFEGMEKIRSAKICVVGAGGIGNPVATQLVAMGVGKLRIVDRDVIEVTNLHRQHLYTDDDIGRVKVEAAAERLCKLNPTVKIEPIPTSVTKYTAESIIKGFDIVIDALDSVDARYALNDACIKHSIPLIYAGALGMVGSVCTILPSKTACLRCMFPELNEEEMPACSTEGVHPSILYLVAGIQVSEAVKIITGREPTLANKLLYIDLNELSFERIQMRPGQRQAHMDGHSYRAYAYQPELHDQECRVAWLQHQDKGQPWNNCSQFRQDVCKFPLKRRCYDCWRKGQGRCGQDLQDICRASLATDKLHHARLGPPFFLEDQF
jgi:adenylyltransferase/sulfurtransferase